MKQYPDQLQDSPSTDMPSSTTKMSVGRRILPVLVLFLLSPFVAEFLLGNIPITLFYVFPFLAPLYGGGAVLIREWTRRTGRGWPTIVLLAVAYGVLEEGLVTQSLFNPNYVGQRLLDYGFIPAIGIAGPWTVFVISLHVAWSMCIPIALVEVMFPQRRTTPWLRTPGMVVMTCIFLIGIALTTLGTLAQYRYVAAPAQLIVSGVIIVGLIIAAFAAFRPASIKEQLAPAPAPLLLAGAMLLAGSLFELVNTLGRSAWPALLVVILTLLLDAVVLWLINVSSHRAGWSDLHRFALAAGGLLVYCWWGFALLTVQGNATVVNLSGQAFWVVLALFLLLSCGRRLYRLQKTL